MKAQPAIIEGRRWAVTPSALSGLVDDKRWADWDGKPSTDDPHQAARRVFADMRYMLMSFSASTALSSMMPGLTTGAFMPDRGMLMPDSGGGCWATAGPALARQKICSATAEWRRWFMRRSR